MTTVRIAKLVQWEMGHRLPFHSGHCSNIHGHSYRMRLTIEGIPDENGMVMDFYQLNALLEPLIESLDHAFICDHDDAIMREFFQLHAQFKVVYVPFVTTVENICHWIAEQLQQRLAEFPKITRLGVRLYETATAYAECEKEVIHSTPPV